MGAIIIGPILGVAICPRIGLSEWASRPSLKCSRVGSFVPIVQVSFIPREYGYVGDIIRGMLLPLARVYAVLLE